MTGSLLALVLAAAAAGEVSSGAEETGGQGPAATVEQKAERRTDALAVPLLSYNSDDKLGFGVAGGLYRYAPDAKPYKHAVGFQLFMTTAGIQSHSLRYDGPSFLGGSLRFEGKLELRRERRAPYFGAGNLASPGADSDDDRFTYDRLAGGGFVRIRFAVPAGLPQPYVGYGFRATRVRAPARSLLADDAPLGIEGGPTGHLLVGVVHDTRDNEGDPTRGGSEELSVRLARAGFGSDYDFGQLTLSLRRFVPIGSRVVVAGRLLGDRLFGQAPFFEWGSTGGLYPADGIGGMSSVRGIGRQRYGGTTKLIANLELRVALAEPRILKQRFKVSAVAFTDAGRAWAEGVPDGAFFRFHPSAGAGLRVGRGAAVVRLDWGISHERQAIYAAFGHLF